MENEDISRFQNHSQKLKYALHNITKNEKVMFVLKRSTFKLKWSHDSLPYKTC